MSKLSRLARPLRLILIAVAIVAGLGFVLWLGEGQDRTPQPSALSNEVSAVDHVRGPESAVVTLVEYSDLQCPACANFHPLVEALVQEYPNDLRFVYRHFPLVSIHPNAFPGAQAAEAASLQGKFFEMSDILFTRQDDWTKLSNPYSKFEEYALELNLDKQKFYTDYRSGEVNARIKADMNSGNAAGIRSTPTFFIDGQPLPEDVKSYDGFVKLIKSKVDAAKAKTTADATATK